MSFFSKLFSRKNKPAEAAEQQNKPRYVILSERGRQPYKILDTEENMKLGFHVYHSEYDAKTLPHEEYPDENLNGVSVSVDVVIGDFDLYSNDDSLIKFRRSAKVLDRDIKRKATVDDADFALYTMLQNELKSQEPSKKAVLIYNLLKVVKSDILTSPERATEEYRQQQKQKEDAVKLAKEKELQAQSKIYKQVQQEIAEKQKLEARKKQEAVSAYMNNIKASDLVR